MEESWRQFDIRALLEGDLIAPAHFSRRELLYGGRCLNHGMNIRVTCAVVRVLPIWKIHTSVELPVSVRVPFSSAAVE